MTSFFPLFAAATHILRLKSDAILDYKSISTNIIIEQTEISKEGVLASPTRTIFSRSSLPVPTERIPGFRVFARRDWLPALKDTSVRARYSPSSSTSSASSSRRYNNNQQQRPPPSWSVAMIGGCEGTMLVKETRTDEEKIAASRLDDSRITGLAITLRAQIIGRALSPDGRSETDVILAESGSQEISAARIIFVRKVLGLVLHTSIGDVAVVLSVAREDVNGCQQRVEQFLAQYSTLASSSSSSSSSSSPQPNAVGANIAAVARNLIRAANGDEIMAFCQLRKKFGLTDYEGRLLRFMKLYSLDDPSDYDISDSQVAQAILREWAPTEELLFVALGTIFGPEQDLLSSWIRFRAFNSVLPTFGDDGNNNGNKTKSSLKELNLRWKKELRGLLAAGNAQTDKALQQPVQEFFTRCCDEVTHLMLYSRKETGDGDDDNTGDFKEPPPFLYLFDKDVRHMLQIDSFGGFSQSVLPVEAIGGDEDYHRSVSSSNNNNDSKLLISSKRVRNGGDSLVDVVSEGTQTRKDAGATAASQCNFFEKPKVQHVSTMAVEYKLTSDETVQTNDHLFFRACEIQTEPEFLTPTTDIGVDATESVATCTRDSQTLREDEIPRRTMKVSTVDDLPKFGFEEEILARDGHLRRELEKNLNEHLSARKNLENDLKVANEAADSARDRLATEVGVRQKMEKDLESLNKELADSTVSLQKMSLQQKFLDAERRGMTQEREEMRGKIDQAKEEIARIEAEKDAKQKDISEKDQLMEQLHADVADRQFQYDSMKRQCDIYAEDAKSSREISDKHFSRMKELEDELLQEKMLRCKFQESVEQNQKSDLLMQIASSESILDKLKRLEQEKDDLLREREFYMTSSNNNNNNIANDEIDDELFHDEDPNNLTASTMKRRMRANRKRNLQHSPRRVKIVREIQTRVDPESGEAYQVEVEVEQERTVEEEDRDPDFQEKVLQARDRLSKYREGRNNLRRPPAAFLDIDFAPDPDPGMPKLMTYGTLTKPRLPSGKAPLLVINESAQKEHLSGRREDRHRKFMAGKMAAMAGSTAPDWAEQSEDSPHSQQVFYQKNPHLAYNESNRGHPELFENNNHNNNSIRSNNHMRDNFLMAAAASSSSPSSSPPQKNGNNNNDYSTPTRNHNNNTNMNYSSFGPFAGAASGPSSLLSPTSPISNNNNSNIVSSPSSTLQKPSSYNNNNLHHNNVSTNNNNKSRTLITQGWDNYRRGLVDAARSCWEQVASGTATAATSATESTQPVAIGSRYEAEGILFEIVLHDAARAAESYAMAMRYWPALSVILRLAGLHDREANGDKDVAVDLYRMAARAGSEAARIRLAEMMIPF